MRVLLDAIENKQLAENVLTRAQRDALRKHSDDAIREHAQQLFAAGEIGDRMKAYEESRAVLIGQQHFDSFRRPEDFRRIRSRRLTGQLKYQRVAARVNTCFGRKGLNSVLPASGQ